VVDGECVTFYNCQMCEQYLNCFLSNLQRNFVRFCCKSLCCKECFTVGKTRDFFGFVMDFSVDSVLVCNNKANFCVVTFICNNRT
jgi:hypothetical protein